MQLKEKKMSNVDFEFTFDISDDLLKTTENTILKQLSKNLKVKGFRKGRVPLDIAKKYISKLEVRKYVLEEFYKQAITKIIDEYKIKPVELPKITMLSELTDDKLSFKVYGDKYPDINLDEYKGIEVEYSGTLEVSDEEVDKSALSLVKAVLPKERLDKGQLAQEGDTSYIEYKVYDNDKVVDQKQGYMLVLDKEKVESELDKLLIDNILSKAEGSEFEFDYSGKKVKGKILTLIREPKVELTNEFIKEKFGYDSVEKFKEEIKKGLEIKLKEKRDDEVFIKIIDGFLQKLDIEVPKSLFEYTYNKMYKEFENYLKQWNLDLDKYLESRNLTKEQLEKDFKDTAYKIIRRDLILDYIAEKEKFNITNEDINLALNSMIKTQDDIKNIKKLMKDEEWRQDLKNTILRQKARRFLIDNAKVKIIDKKDEEDKKDKE